MWCCGTEGLCTKWGVSGADSQSSSVVASSYNIHSNNRNHNNLLLLLSVHFYKSGFFKGHLASCFRSARSPAMLIVSSWDQSCSHCAAEAVPCWWITSTGLTKLLLEESVVESSSSKANLIFPAIACVYLHPNFLEVSELWRTFQLGMKNKLECHREHRLLPLSPISFSRQWDPQPKPPSIVRSSKEFENETLQEKG